jgi:hypothetical protein
MLLIMTATSMKNMKMYFIVFTISLMDHIFKDYLPPNPSFMPE